MKKVISILAGLAAVGGAAYLLHRKYGKPSTVITGDFEDEEPIVLNDDTVEEDTKEASAEE